MTTGTKLFRTIVAVLLGVTMLWTAFVSYAFFYFAAADADRRDNERYGLYVGGVDVTSANAHDILGNGTATYDPVTSKLTLNNATIAYDYAPIYSEIDLLIELVGENKLIFKDKAVGTAIYASSDILRKDLSIFGDGSLEISFENVSESCTGIVADTLYIGSDLTITTPSCSNIVNGIVCTSSLILRNGATVTVNNGAARSSTAVSVRGNLTLESGSTLSASVAPGSTAACSGVSVDGNLTLGKDATLTTSVDDTEAENSECISVSGVMHVGRNAVVTASAKKAYSIRCSGSISVSDGATVSAMTDNEGADIFCHGAFVCDDATVSAEIAALGGIHNTENNSTCARFSAF